MNTTATSRRVSQGLSFLIETLKHWDDFPAPTEAVLSAWSQSIQKRHQLMIPLGGSAQGQWLKVQARALEDLYRLLDDKPNDDYTPEPPPFCPSCQRRLGAWDCQICGYAVVNLERFIKETLASMHAVQHLPENVLLLPDPARKRLLFLDLSRPGHVLWEIPLAQVCSYPQYALYLPDHQVLVTDSQTKQILIVDLLGHVTQRLDQPEHKLVEPVMATAYLAPEGEQRYLVVDRGGNQVLLLKNSGELHWRYRELKQPNYAAITPEQTVLIADTGHARVLELSLPHGRLHACFSQYLKAPIWVQRDEQKQLLVVDERPGCLQHYTPGGQLKDSWPINAGPNLKAHQIFARRNGQLVFVQTEQAFELRPGLSHFSGFWEFADLICQDLPTLVARPVLRQTRALTVPQALPPRVTSLADALKQTELFGQARPEVIDLARKLCRCVRLKAGQSMNIEAQGSLIYIARGQVELTPAESDKAIKIYGSSALLGEPGLSHNQPAGRELRALVPTKLLILSHFSLDTLMPYLSKNAPVQPRRGAPTASLGERVKQILSRPAQEARPAAPHQGVKFNLYYTPAEREILLSAEDYRYRSYEVHLQFLPQRQQASSAQLEELVKVFQLIKAHGFLVKHRWFDNGRLLVAHVILNGVDTAPLKRKLQVLERLDKLSIEPVVFVNSGRKKPRRVHFAGA